MNFYRDIRTSLFCLFGLSFLEGSFNIKLIFRLKSFNHAMYLNLKYKICPVLQGKTEANWKDQYFRTTTFEKYQILLNLKMTFHDLYVGINVLSKCDHAPL